MFLGEKTYPHSVKVSKWTFGGSCDAKDISPGTTEPTDGTSAENAESGKFTNCACVCTRPTGEGEEGGGDAGERRRRTFGKTSEKSESEGPPSPDMSGLRWSMSSRCPLRSVAAPCARSVIRES